MDGGRFYINKAVSSLVARLSRCFGKIAISRRNLAATALDIVESAQCVPNFEQIATIGRLGWDGGLSGALEPTQSVACLHTRQTRPPEIELRDGQQLGRSNETFNNPSKRVIKITVHQFPINISQN